MRNINEIKSILKIKEIDPSIFLHQKTNNNINNININSKINQVPLRKPSISNIKDKLYKPTFLKSNVRENKINYYNLSKKPDNISINKSKIDKTGGNLQYNDSLYDTMNTQSIKIKEN